MAPALRLRSLVDDVRAMGPGAVLRAGYEASKRFGGHRLIFGSMGLSESDAQARTPFGPPAAIPTAAAERAIADADRVVAGEIVVFGRRIDVGDGIDWHHAIEEEARWPAVPWWTVDLRSDDRVGDVKWVWELGRCRHLVTLARAAHLAPTRGYGDVLARHLVSWLDQNPPEIGVHWYSNLEIALRAVAWLEVLSLAGGQLSETVRRRMSGVLRHSGRHLVADMPYTMAAMRNNHLLGDGLGMVVLGKAFAGTPAGERWRRWGDRIMLKQLVRQIRADGSGMEDSLSYHRFVLEMLAVRALAGNPPPAIVEALEAGAQFLARLGVLEGPVPQYGDWDEGRVLTSGGDPADVTGTVRLALALAGTGAPEAWRSRNDECAWYAPAGEPVAPAEPEKSGASVGGGIGRATAGSIVVWLKAGSAPSHGHADLTSVAVRWGGVWAIGDPGTGTYNGPLRIRNYFKTSASHNVVRVSGEDQLVPHRVFRWRHAAGGEVGSPVAAAGWVLMWGAHDAYTRLYPPRRVARVVAIRPSTAHVADFVEGRPVQCSISLTAPPGVELAPPELALPDGGTLALDFPEPVVAARGEEGETYDGWWSDTYGHTMPTWRVEAKVASAGPVVWGLRDEHVAPPAVEQGAVRFGSAVVRVVWGPGQVTLAVRHDGQEERRTLELGR